MTTQPTYTPRDSHAGNQWYVAYNTAQAGNQSVTSQAVNNLADLDLPSGYEAVGAGDATDDAIFAAAAKATAALSKPYPAGQGPTVSVQNITWSNVNGPYGSYAQAEAAIPAIQSGAAAPGEASKIPGVGDIDDLINWLSQGSIWERAAEVLGGFVILYVALKAMTGLDPIKSAVNGAKKVAKVAAVAAPK
jgi:hypothetical protein